MTAPLWTISRWNYVHGWYDSERRTVKRHPYGYDSHRAGKHWDKVVTRAVAEGRLSPPDAKHLGWKQPEQNRRVWRPLPDALYHVTTDTPGILRRGLRSRRQLRLEKGMGLGGGPNDPISFTEEPAHAKAIQETLVDLPRFLRGEVTLSDLERRAAKPRKGWERQWLGWFRFHFQTSAESDRWKAGGDAAHPSDSIYSKPIRVRLLERGILSKERCVPTARRAELPVVDDDGARRGRLYKTSYDYICGLYVHKPRTEEELLHERYEAYRMWAQYREDVGGPAFPHFEKVDLTKVAALRPYKVGVFRFKPCAGAYGDPWRGDHYLKEWQVYSNRAVHLVAVNGGKPPNGTHPSLLRCPTR